MDASPISDVLSHQIHDKLRTRYSELAKEYDPIGNIIAVFFHDLMIHFSGIIIHRHALCSYEDKIKFPWVNKKYALSPFRIEKIEQNVVFKQSRLVRLIKKNCFLPIVGGNSIPYGDGQQRLLRQILNVGLGFPEQSEVYLPHLSSQKEYLDNVISELCDQLSIGNESVIRQNWQRYMSVHTSEFQPSIKQKGAILGTRVNLHNRKLAINFMQQQKEVIGFTHGEISANVFDEPVFNYSDLSLCTTVVDYGRFTPRSSRCEPLIKPRRILKRSSQVIRKTFNVSDSITYPDLSNSSVLYIPTIYQGNFLYGPSHGYENSRYYKWHLAVADFVPNLSFKLHPKTRWRPEYPCVVEERLLSDCMHDYDVYIFDFFATGAAQAIFSDKPVIYFDIGLRILATEFYEDLSKRCAIIPIDMDGDLGEQISIGLMECRNQNSVYSNTHLSKYSLCSKDSFSMGNELVNMITD